MVVTHTRLIACSNPSKCSADFLVRLGNSATFRLEATAATDTVHGSVTITHYQPPQAHLITVEVYDAGEPPNREHASTKARAEPFPTSASVKALLDSP